MSGFGWRQGLPEPSPLPEVGVEGGSGSAVGPRAASSPPVLEPGSVALARCALCSPLGLGPASAPHPCAVPEDTGFTFHRLEGEGGMWGRQDDVK